MTKEIFPQWVIVKGQIRNVSDFSHLPPSYRPEAICPLCNKPVTMKLGSERVHHYAHQPDTICATTKPETALHLNTKFYIYHQLLSGTRLYLEQQCSNGCGRNRNVPWVENWDDVKVEFEIGQFRPDITILKNGRIIKAIEVKVTHQVEEEKEAFYKTGNIGWLEVDACESMYEGESAWSIDKPLPFAGCKPAMADWTCDVCIKQLREEEKRQLRAQKEWEYKQHNYLETIYAKMVDFYYPSGKKYRETYYLRQIVRNDKPGGVLVTTPKVGIMRQNGEITEALLKLAFDAVKPDINRRRNLGAIVDEREWSPWVSGRKFVARDTERFPFLYEWDDAAKKWINREQREIEEWNARVKEAQEMLNIPKQEGVCIHCGQKTTDYWSFSPVTRECKCRKCYREGKY